MFLIFEHIVGGNTILRLNFSSELDLIKIFGKSKLKIPENFVKFLYWYFIRMK